MILIDNKNILRMKNRELFNKLVAIENKVPTGNVIVEPAKTDVPTLKIIHDGRTQYVHSKYDPVRDAERFIAKFSEETMKHILFVGAGLGYHIQAFMTAHPNNKFSIYEPDEEVLSAFLSHVKLDDLPLQNLSQILTEIDFDSPTSEVQQLLQASKGMLQIITLPVYEKMYGSQIATITKQMVDSLKDKRTSLEVNMSYQKRWVVNSVQNFPVVLETPNIMHHIDKDAFAGKPAIIVAAGPSLNEEFENLRKIKENGLAYIFSVGSAINALIEHDIYPDAACTYDPTELNQFVVQKIKDNDITEIPLIFGSSVGFETLEAYPGEMLHMITSQDTVSPQLLDTSQGIGIVMDAPSIAVVTFQLLSQFNCNPIVLVGQNLGYQANNKYAAGIQYDFVENELNEEEQAQSSMIRDVYGNKIQTNDSFNIMRQQLEMHIAGNNHIEVINTTKGGAEIKGTRFEQLEDLMKERLQSQVVDNDWMEKTGAYNVEFTKRRLRQLIRDERNCKKLMQSSLDELQKISVAAQNRKSTRMEHLFAAFDKQFSKLKRNGFYIGFIEPMLKVQNEKLSEESQFIRYERDVLKKAAIVVQAFSVFLQEVHAHYEFVLPYFEEMQSRIEERTSEIENG